MSVYNFDKLEIFLLLLFLENWEREHMIILLCQHCVHVFTLS